MTDEATSGGPHAGEGLRARLKGAWGWVGLLVVVGLLILLESPLGRPARDTLGRGGKDNVRGLLLIAAVFLPIVWVLRRTTARERQRLRTRYSLPLPVATEATDADLGMFETDALVEMLRHSRDHEERQRVLSELERRGMVEEM